MDASAPSPTVTLSDTEAVERLVSHWGTQNALAEHYGVTQSAISQWIRIRIPPERRAEIWLDLMEIGVELPKSFLRGPLQAAS